MQCYMLTTSSPSGSEVDEGEVLALVEGVLASGGRVLAPDEGGLACSCLRRAACMSDICLLRSLSCAGKFTISSVGGGGGGGASSCGGNSCVSSFTREVNSPPCTRGLLGFEDLYRSVVLLRDPQFFPVLVNMFRLSTGSFVVPFFPGA